MGYNPGMLTIAMLVGLFISSLLVQSAILWVSARLVRAGSPGFRRALACSLLLTAAGLVGQMIAAAVAVANVVMLLIVSVLQLLIVLLVSWLIMARVLRITFVRSMFASVPYFAVSIPIALATVYLTKAYCMEAFVNPTNSMAPTLVGWHHEVTCPLCQGRAIIPGRSPDEPDDRFGHFAAMPRFGICMQCRKISEFQKWPEELHGPMRIICNKWLQPKRGDTIVYIFQRGLDPRDKVMYVKRLVGLPGEKIDIKEGAVSINGIRWDPPADLAGIEYHPLAAGFPPANIEPQERSWQLGPDEFFVLGDFTTNSSDSRESGPVPRANLVGVATMVYWPPSAWRILR
jgi:signal peptidase I